MHEVSEPRVASLTATAPPFVIFALPRSRTTWLSRFLSYRDWHCAHDASGHFRTLDDAKAWLSQPNTGAVETAAAPHWRLLARYRPDARVVVIIRPVAEVVDSLMRVELRGTAIFDRAELTKRMTALHAKLMQVTARFQKAAWVDFDMLRYRKGAKCVFEHCLPYEFDEAHWDALEGENIQSDVAAAIRYARAYAPQLERLNAIARQSVLSEFALRRIAPGPIAMQEERFDDWYRDGQHLFREHLACVGQHPETFSEKNIELMRAYDAAGALQIVTARSNGRMFGYLMTRICQSWETSLKTAAINMVTYASPAFPGLGKKMHRAALKTLVAKGVDETFMVAGHAGEGPRIGALYRSLGAALDGELYRLNLREC